MTRLTSVNDLIELKKSLVGERVDPDGTKRQSLWVCCGTACRAGGSVELADKLQEEAKNNNIPVDVIKTGCLGMCQKGPLIKTMPDGYLYQKVKTKHTAKIIDYTAKSGFAVRELFYRIDDLDYYYKRDIFSGPKEKIEDLPFYQKQLRLILEGNERVAPENIHYYIAQGGYEALAKILSEKWEPEKVIDEITKSGLRGRGGAGFPAGIKWKATRQAKGEVKVIVANGDEGDPGAFMDRSIMEGNPHCLLEGMLIAGYAVGANYGFIYVRHEYPLALKNISIAIQQAKELGLIGKNILGSGFDFDISIREGAGAFVCGEETALLASIEGKRGFPSPKPPFPAESGVWAFPTCINNIETLANVPYIVKHGAEKFSSIGTENSKGTKVFALAGKIKNTGLIEVPMGITLREIIYDIGGGIKDGKRLKAVQVGGPSGGCIPADLIDVEVDFDSLSSVGAIMGSGGIIVLDEDDCMVSIAKYFLEFIKEESCGKCPPCRIGSYQMLEILTRITEGKGEMEDIDRLENIAKSMQVSALCGLGKTAPNPVLSTMRYFRDEYEEHIKHKYCRAKSCRINTYKIDNDECFLCGLCKKVCPADAVIDAGDQYIIDQEKCIKCKACYDACPIDVIKSLGSGEETIDKSTINLKGELRDGA